jgi:hypothetical protein
MIMPNTVERVSLRARIVGGKKMGCISLEIGGDTHLALFSRRLLV